MTDDTRSIELDVEVPGTPEEVWRAIATGPGISSWYVPHEVEEREGGVAIARFGAGEGMEVPGRVIAWEPPHRIVFAGEEGMEAMAFEWLVEARDHGTCVVRLVNSGFGTGEEWDAQYDGMLEGWPLFLLNLRLHMEHFKGRTATAMLPGAMWTATRDDAFATLTSALGLPTDPNAGDHVEATADGAPHLAGTVADIAPLRLAFLLDQPAPGTAFVAAEGMGDQTGVSVWSYLYGDDAGAIVERDEPAWAAWLADAGPAA